MNQSKSKESTGRGGARKGAGRKPGSKTKKTRAIAFAATALGITPLEYMLDVLRDPNQCPDLRFEAAKAAAPYMHPRLAAVEHTGPDGGAIKHSIRVKFG
jgi:hypothetical protein